MTRANIYDTMQSEKTTDQKEVLKMVLYVTKQISKKSGNAYFALIADIGYRKLYLNMQTDTLAELCGMSVRELYDIKADEKIEIANTEK